jgi:hypothetical protein
MKEPMNITETFEVGDEGVVFGEEKSTQKESSQNAISKDVALIYKNKNSIDSLEQVKNNIDAKTQMLIEQGEFKPAPGDPRIGPIINKFIRQGRDYFEKKGIDKKIQKLENANDSLKNKIQIIIKMSNESFKP